MRVFAINHSKAQIMAVGHKAWFADIEQMDEALRVYRPAKPESVKLYEQSIQDFAPDVLLLEDDARKLNYKRVRGFWA